MNAHMLRLRATGRGRILTTVIPDARAVTVRMDDERRAEWWAEITLSESQLRDMLACIECEQMVESVDSPQGYCEFCGSGPACVLCGRREVIAA
jgi:hypothetical protein